ncbi:MAG TPA: glucose 1-dehydrogenase [Opitutaceae bacterium]|jgi:NAD(P)-dependent dehydrogenase (short-subunit alcohol dehydrogenase family)
MDPDPGSVKGKGVLVTGAGTGIGREIALEFARQGAHVVFHYSQDSEDALGGVAEARALGVRAESVRADFSDLAGVARVAEAAREFLGRVDVLVNNAGITYNSPFLEVTAEHYDKVFDVNVRAGFFLAQRLVPAMEAAGGGAICNIASIHGYQGAPEHAVYAGTKGAVIAFTRALAIEVAHRGVRVNAIAPGWIAVENHLAAEPSFSREEAVQAAGQRIPVGHFGVPVDVARLAVFLCSEAARYIVGQTLVIDGGTTSLMSLVSDFRARSSARFAHRYL